MSGKKGHLDPEQVLQQALVVMQPLVLWLLRSGVRHPEFSAAIKRVFLRQAAAELTRLDEKLTDSALSLLSGLHRKDVRAFMTEHEEQGSALEDMGEITRESLGRPTLATQVMTRWLTSGFSDDLPVAGMTYSFEALVRQVSSDVHPRSVLKELERLDLAREEGDRVRLLRQSFIPDKTLLEAGNLLAGNAADHLAAGVHNLSAADDRAFLEQSVFASGLFADSIVQLEGLARELWMEVLNRVARAAVPLCEKDEPEGGQQRIRIGMYCYSEPIQGNTTVPGKTTRKRRNGKPVTSRRKGSK